MFPVLNEKLDMSHNIEEHAAFVPAMVEFEKYCEGIRDGYEEYDAEKLRSLLKGFGDVLSHHLHAEVSCCMVYDVADPTHKFNR